MWESIRHFSIQLGERTERQSPLKHIQKLKIKLEALATQLQRLEINIRGEGSVRTRNAPSLAERNHGNRCGTTRCDDVSFNTAFFGEYRNRFHSWLSVCRCSPPMVGVREFTGCCYTAIRESSVIFPLVKSTEMELEEPRSLCSAIFSFVCVKMLGLVIKVPS